MKLIFFLYSAIYTPRLFWCELLLEISASKSKCNGTSNVMELDVTLLVILKALKNAVYVSVTIIWLLKIIH